MRRNTPQTEPNPEGRPTCYGCFRPTTHCVCRLIEPFKAHSNILILQHPHERKKYYSTAKLVLGAVTNSKLLRGIAFQEQILREAIGDKTPYLLFPGEAALDCEQVVLDESHTIIVIDGTWSEAGKILRRNPLLTQFPSLSFKRGYSIAV